MISEKSQGQIGLEKCSKIFQWNYSLMSFLGLWPSELSNIIYFINFSYFSYQMVLEYLDLFLFIDNLEHVLMNLTENMAFSQIFVRLIMLRLYIKEFRGLIEEVHEDFNPVIYTEDEKILFTSYYDKAKTFMKLLIINTAFTATSYYAGPFLGQMSQIIEYAKADNVNNTRNFEFILPYRFYTFYEINDVSTYFWTYGSQLPFVFISGFGQSAADCLMVSFVYHVAGQMAVLAGRITNLDTDPANCDKELRKVVKFHIRLLRMGRAIEQAFSITLLANLFGATSLVCILGFQILTCLNNGEKAILISLFAFIFLVLLILFCHCTVGESLVTESQRLCEAFYDCKWYNMSKRNSSIVILSIARSQTPLRLTAGKFSTFCLATFTDSIKTSMGYLSVLRTVMVNDV